MPLKSDMKATLKSEGSDTLRLRTSLHPVTAVLVVIGFMMVALAAIVVWWVFTQNVI